MISIYDMNLIHIFFTFDFQLSSLPYRYDKPIIVFVLTYKIKRHWVKLKSFTSNPIFLPRFIISANKNLKYKEFFSINASTYIPIYKHHFKRNVAFIKWLGTREHRLYMTCCHINQALPQILKGHPCMFLVSYADRANLYGFNWPQTHVSIKLLHWPNLVKCKSFIFDLLFK